MTDDTEARLRAALHAYAERVEDPGAELPRVPAAPVRGGTVRRWRAAVLVAAAVAAVTGGAWWIGAGSPGGDVVAGSSVDESSPETGTDGAPPGQTDADDDATLSEPYADAAVPATGLPAAPEVGVPYALDLYTHCGVLGTDVGGTWFAADPPLVEEYGPPLGWGNPEQPGTLTLTAPDEAMFTDDLGHEVVLRAAPDSARPPLCG
jgi:hypothetical protein